MTTRANEPRTFSTEVARRPVKPHRVQHWLPFGAKPIPVAVKEHYLAGACGGLNLAYGMWAPRPGKLNGMLSFKPALPIEPVHVEGLAVLGKGLCPPPRSPIARANPTHISQILPKSFVNLTLDFTIKRRLRCIATAFLSYSKVSASHPKVSA